MIIISTEVDEYFRAVQSRRDDLSPGVMEELTGGLAADLSDVAAESEDALASRLGPAADYADELRAAAGLPPRATGVTRGTWRGTWDSVRSGITLHPRYPAAKALAIELRPLWWVLRAGAGTVLLLTLFGFYRILSMSSVLLFALLAGVSIALGRREAALPGRARFGMRMINGGAALLCLWVFVLFLGSSWVSGSGSYAFSGPDDPYVGVATPVEGIWVNGERVYNVFAYDAEGKLINQAQLFDQNGRPIAYRIPESEYYTYGSEPKWEATYDAFGKSLTNIFPRNFQTPLTDANTGELIPMKPPFKIVPPLAKPSAQSGPSVDPMKPSLAAPNPSP
ncbi:MAG: hypothetical protein ACRC0L_01785 [Angustibacter sp.]